MPAENPAMSSGRHVWRGCPLSLARRALSAPAPVAGSRPAPPPVAPGRDSHVIPSAFDPPSQPPAGPLRPAWRRPRVRSPGYPSPRRRLTRAARDVAHALLKRVGTDGRCDPSHVTIGIDAGCCDRTVRRALATLRVLGLVDWDRRLVRDGSECSQISSQYVLAPLDAPPLPATRIAAGHCVRQSRKIIDEEAAARRSRDQQLLALGYPLPEGWR
jgi:hypothetical protein